MGIVPAVLEPVGVCHNDGKRPDGIFLIPWRQGLLLLWDFTCSNTLAPSNVSTSSRGTSRLANATESAKFRTFHFSLSVMRPLVFVDPVHVHCAANRLPSHGADWKQ